MPLAACLKWLGILLNNFAFKFAPFTVFGGQVLFTAVFVVRVVFKQVTKLGFKLLLAKTSG
jgi:hypothetical protein